MIEKQEDKENINYNKALRKGMILVFLFIAILVISVIALWNLEIDKQSFSDIWQKTDPLLMVLALMHRARLAH